jgi:DNA-binding transcriptional LysR family regulator
MKGLKTLEPEMPKLRGLASAGAEVSIHRLQACWAVAHTGSMTRAAKMMGFSQPGLCQQLGGFEAAIGGQLFNRRAGRLELTELGSAILTRVE